MLVDGTSENSIGLTAGGEIVCLNEFAVIPGSETITSINIAWGTPTFPDPSLNGLPYTVAVWSDPNGDGSPTDAVLLTTASGVVADEGTDTFIDVAITPTTITTQNFFVGFGIDQVAGQFPSAFDEDNPLPNRSWIAGSNTQGGADLEDLNNNDIPVATIESFGLFGNWMIRADAGAQVSPTPTATATATGTPSSCSWGAGADMPVAGIRFSGVFFPANGKFYAMGGRDMQTGGTEFTNPFEYDPVSNSWTTKAATYPDPFVGNTECAVANDSGTDYIYCVGGSQSSTATETGRVFRYDPVADVITTVATDWPPGDASTLPGGITVFNNQIYILGGYDVLNGIGSDQIWEFTPNPAGWVQKSAVLPFPLGYIPTTTIGSLIYTGGGADITGGTLTDTTNSFKYDPVADSITTITAIPRATSNTRGLNFNGHLWVPGGQFPTPGNEVDIYDPVANSWSVGSPMLTARRNSAMDTNGTDHIWAAGGYDATGVASGTMDIFCQGGGTPTPTPACTPSYTTAIGTGTITPGGTDIGNHCDDCTTDIVLPFPVSVYGNAPVT